MHSVGRDNAEHGHVGGRGELVVYRSPSGKCIIAVKPNGNTAATERTPLIPYSGDCRKLGGSDSNGRTELGLTFVAVLVSSFLSAFDFTVIAAIFPLMYPRLILF